MLLSIFVYLVGCRCRNAVSFAGTCLSRCLWKYDWLGGDNEQIVDRSCHNVCVYISRNVSTAGNCQNCSSHSRTVGTVSRGIYLVIEKKKTLLGLGRVHQLTMNLSQQKKISKTFCQRTFCGSARGECTRSAPFHFPIVSHDWLFVIIQRPLSQEYWPSREWKLMIEGSTWSQSAKHARLMLI